MDIYLTAVDNGQGDFHFPYLPEEIKLKRSTNYQSYDIITIGQVKIPRGTDVEQISWNGYFFGKARRNMTYLGTWISPKRCEAQLTKWYRQGTVLRLLVTETSINMDVTIAKFECTHLHLMDVKYSITFNAYRELKMYTTSEMGITAYEPSTTPRPSSEGDDSRASEGSRYTITNSDTLWGIAQRSYGDGSRWRDIYDANADTLDTEARNRGMSSSDQGHWIWAGTQIVIP